jgi:predicted PurR-regulated permease PerM
MDFSLDRFYRLNRRAIIWLVLFALLYFLRDFLLLIFLTFIVGFFAFPAAQFLIDKLRLSRGFAITLVYAGILVGYITMAWWISPNLIEEAGKLNAQIPDIKLKLNELREEYSGRYPQIAGLVESYIPAEDLIPPGPSEDEEIRRSLDMILAKLDGKPLPGGDEEGEDPIADLIETTTTNGVRGLAGFERDDEGKPDGGPAGAAPEGTAASGDPGPEDENTLAEDIPAGAPYPLPPDAASELEDAARGPSYIDREIDRWTGEIRRGLAASSARVVRFALQSLLAILFSYLIMLDFGRLSKELSGLKSSKLRDFYEEAGQPVVSFALSVGRGFQAIAVIAFITMLMLAVLLLVFRIPQVLLLSLIVFITSLVPIVGVVFEVMAILLVTFNAYGLDYHFWGMVVGISMVHLVITYVIAPIIFGRQFRLNMVLILIILYIGQRVGGMWGLILGVPVANYFIRDVFAVPFIEEKEATRKRRTIEIKSEDAPAEAGRKP